MRKACDHEEYLQRGEEGELILQGDIRFSPAAAATTLHGTHMKCTSLSSPQQYGGTLTTHHDISVHALTHLWQITTTALVVGAGCTHTLSLVILNRYPYLGSLVAGWRHKHKRSVVTQLTTT